MERYADDRGRKRTESASGTMSVVRCPELRCELNLDGSCQDISTILMDIPDPDYGCSYFETKKIIRGVELCKK